MGANNRKPITTKLYRTEFMAWSSMRSRCYDKTKKYYYMYGGRGIEVCDRWKNSFKNFLEDMGTRPSPDHSLDRINNNGNYCPSNCKWSTSKEQQRNTRRNKNLTYKGETMCATAWAEKLGMPPSLILTRIKRGWSTEDILTTPHFGKYKGALQITIGDKTQSVNRWAKEYKISPSTIMSRIRTGWDHIEAVITPARKTNKNK